MFRFSALGLVLACLPASLAAQTLDKGDFGEVIRIEHDDFGAGTGRISFSEFPQGTQNPIYSPPTYGGTGTDVTVGFGGFFEGQSIGTHETCPRGAAVTGCVVGEPLAPLRLALHSPDVRIVNDTANPNAPVLSGSPLFNGPVSFLFSRDLAGVGLAGGYFNSVQATAIHAFDRQGRLIGGVRNLELGVEYLALVTKDGSDKIAGVQFSLVGDESAGFAIDDLSFAFSNGLRLDQIEGLEPPPPSFTLIPGLHQSRPLKEGE